MRNGRPSATPKTRPSATTPLSRTARRRCPSPGLRHADHIASLIVGAPSRPFPNTAPRESTRGRGFPNPESSFLLFTRVRESMAFSEVTSHLCTLRRSCNSQATAKTPHLGDAAGPPYRYAASLYNGAGRALLLLVTLPHPRERSEE